MRLNKTEEILYYIFAVLVPLQIYFPVAGSIHLSLATAVILFIFLLMAGKIFTQKNIKELKKSSGFIFFIALCLLFTLRLVSPGDLRNGIKITFFLWLGPIVFLSIRDLNQVFKIKLLRALLYFSLPIMLISLFQAASESFKMLFLNLPIAKLFIEPDTLRGVVQRYAGNNILGFGRGGGFFVNVNIAALYFNLIICGICYLILNKRKVSGLDAFVLFSTVLGVLSTASSAGIAVMSMIFIAMIFVILKKRVVAFSIRKSIAGIFLIILSLQFLLILEKKMISGKAQKISAAASEGRLLQKVFNTSIERIKMKFNRNLTSGRSRIWITSFNVLREKWLFGYGFSNKAWDIAYGKKESISYPPHNIFLAVWIYMGLVGAILLFCFMFFYFLYFMKQLKKNDFDPRHFIGAIIILILFLHSLTENLVFANIRIDMLFWLLLGIIEDKT